MKRRGMEGDGGKEKIKGRQIERSRVEVRKGGVWRETRQSGFRFIW